MKVALAPITQIPEGALKEVEFFGRSVFLTKVGEVYNAFVNVCTHAGGTMQLNEGRLVCDWHGACFELKTGKKLEGPGQQPLIRLPVRVEEEQLFYVWNE
jgi:nitrite reductase/ring-hydroxylating ferredoxin subunit